MHPASDSATNRPYPPGPVNPPATDADRAMVGALTSRDPELEVTAARLTGRTLLDLVVDPGGIPTYRPSFYTCHRPATIALADAYDAAQASRGDPRRVYRMGCWQSGCEICFPPLTVRPRKPKRTPRQVLLALTTTEDTTPPAPPPAIVPELDNADREDLRSFRRDLPCLYCKAPISDLPCCGQCQDES